MLGEKKSLVHTYTTRNFGGVIIQSKTTGKKQVKLHSEKFYQHEINKFNVNDEVTINITNKKPKRTEQQNRYYWGVYLPLIAKETGESKIERLHNLFKGEFLTIKIVKVLGKPVREIKSTTDLSVNDFTEYIMKIEAMTEIAAPPTENYGLAPLKKKKTIEQEFEDY